MAASPGPAANDGMQVRHRAAAADGARAVRQLGQRNRWRYGVERHTTALAREPRGCPPPGMSRSTAAKTAVGLSSGPARTGTEAGERVLALAADLAKQLWRNRLLSAYAI